MANKIAPPPAKRAGADEGADDALVLLGKTVAIVDGQEVTVREYSFIETLQLRPLYAPLLADLRDVMQQELPTIEVIQDILASHAEETVQLMAISAGVEAEWISALNPREGVHLQETWWSVNGPFFMRSAISSIKQTRLLAALRSAQSNGPLGGHLRPARQRRTRPPTAPPVHTEADCVVSRCGGAPRPTRPSRTAPGHECRLCRGKSRQGPTGVPEGWPEKVTKQSPNQVR